MSHADIWRKSIPGRGNSKFKSPGSRGGGGISEHLRNVKETGVK